MKQQIINKRSFVTIFIIFLVLTIVSITYIRRRTSIVFAGTPGSIIINEIMYNPGTGNQNDEFIELYNTTASDIDLTDWSFSNGVTLSGNGKFSSGTIIQSHSYLLVSPNISQTLVTYGVSAVAEYAPSSLSNGGETITLVDENNNQITSVEYDDIVPWPSSPDGNGPSLELKATNLDPTDPSNWGASLSNGGTPLQQNSNVGLSLPEINNVTDPNDIPASQAVNISATITGVDINNVELIYKVNFDTDVIITMYDDGVHNDANAGDNIYGAQIPGQDIKTLVRFKISATNGSGTQSSPSNDESINYHGYYIKDPGISSDTPIIEWFITDSDYASLSASHRFDDVYLNCVVVYGDDVYDNSKVKVRGNDSRWETKLSYKFKLPTGYKLKPAGANIEINNFTMLGVAKHSTTSRFTHTWWVAKQSKIPTPDVIQSRLNKNGVFEGAYVYIDKYDAEWRQTNGFSSYEMYDGESKVLSGAPDTTRLIQLYNDLENMDRNDPLVSDYLLDNFDIPAQINYMVARSAIGLNDTSDKGNIIIYYNPNNQRWASLLWDLDGTAIGTNSQISIYDTSGNNNLNLIPIQKKIYNDSKLRSMYMRRLRTVYDKIYDSDTVSTIFDNYAQQANANDLLDIVKWPQALNWGSNDTFFTRTSVNQYNQNLSDQISKQKLIIESFQRIKLGIPPSQTDSDKQSISISEIEANNNNADEYIKLSNSASVAVDVSEWILEGINYTLPVGTVIPANESVYLVKDDLAYKSTHTPVLVVGQYNNDLGNSGNLTLKTDTGALIDSEGY